MSDTLMFIAVDFHRLWCAFSGNPKWNLSLKSPIVSLYLWSDTHFHQVPIATVAKGALRHISSSTALAVRTKSSIIQAEDHILLSSLFIGINKYGVYAMPSLVEEGSIMSESSIPLLPGNVNPTLSPEVGTSTEELGHIYLPIKTNTHLYPLHPHLGNPFSKFLTAVPPKPPVHQHQSSEQVDRKDPSWLSRFLMSPVFSVFMSSITATVVTILIIGFMAKRLPNLTAHPPEPVSRGSVNGSSTKSAPLEEASNVDRSPQVSTVSDTSVSCNSQVTVGKITIDTNAVLGHGSHGTTVYRGNFDKRKVAVKRILRESFLVADREVELLREADQHSHVIRYFCMEEDDNFCYIALELCQATVHEYVEDWRFDRGQIDDLTILQQATNGLVYLHELGIVHRDVKPRNVLISQKASSGEARALLSDFGLCRKLPNGKVSYTAASGITGTEGWIAPEMMQATTRITMSVDVFSMGCLFYYVLSGGEHPFGPTHQRQGNIEAGMSKLTKLGNQDHHHAYAATDIVNRMIAHNPAYRPSTRDVLKHCLFWSKSKQLAFLQDVSDRIEKEPSSSLVVQALERDASSVLRGDWRNNVGEDLRQGAYVTAIICMITCVDIFLLKCQLYTKGKEIIK
jgi:serine/threonine-protein kinase/endoribonuclease IRE1